MGTAENFDGARDNFQKAFNEFMNAAADLKRLHDTAIPRPAVMRPGYDPNADPNAPADPRASAEDAKQGEPIAHDA